MRKAISSLLLLAVFFSCQYENSSVRRVDKSETQKAIATALDSVYLNPALSRQLLRGAFEKVADSMEYYQVLQAYGQVCLVAAQHDSAKMLARSVMRYADRQKSDEEVDLLHSLSYNVIGNSYAIMRNIDSALFYYAKALDLYQRTSSRDKIPDLYINIADMYMRNGDYAKSALNYRKALAVTDSLGMTGHFGFPIYTGLAQLYMELRDYDLSDQYFRLAEERYASRPLNEQFFFCNSRGNYFFFREAYPEALTWFRKGKALLNPAEHQFSINLANANMGEIFFHLNQPDSSRFYLDKAERYFSAFPELPVIYHINTIRAGLALQDGHLAQAGHFLAAKIGNVPPEPTFVLLRNRYVEDYYARAGNYREAYKYLKRSVLMDDSTRSERTRMRIAEMDMRFTQDTTLLKKEMLIMGQAADIHSLRMRNVLWVTLALLILAVTVIVYSVMRRQKERQWRGFYEQLTRLRLFNIRNRVSPHFMFNVLNREINASDDLRKSNLHGLVLMLRRSLEMTDQAWVTLAQELEFVDAYIKIEQQRLGSDFSLRWQIDPSVEVAAVRLPPMILQIPVENAIKHGLAPLPGEKRLSLVVKKMEKGTSIVISDNGSGYRADPSQRSDGTGTGLKVIYQILDLFNLKNEEKITFHILQPEDVEGTVVEIYIPDRYKYV